MSSSTRTSSMKGLEQLALPPGYHLDLTHDPDAPHLRRPDGWPILVLGPAATREAVERLAWADHHSRRRRLRPNAEGASRS
jgi:hypothetical protein